LGTSEVLNKPVVAPAGCDRILGAEVFAGNLKVVLV
jgi:hypothetical protein